MLHVFLFSSRRRHTRSDRDWSSDVCSSDLKPPAAMWAKRSSRVRKPRCSARFERISQPSPFGSRCAARPDRNPLSMRLSGSRSEEHTSELQSRSDLVCRLLLEKKKKTTRNIQQVPINDKNTRQQANKRG